MQRLLFVFLFCLQFPLLAQESSDVLLTIDKEAITVDEFTRVYEKNLNLVEDKDQRNPKAYLDLFIDYKLKVQKAYDLELDKNESYQKELANYRKQIIKGHLTDVNVTEELVKEAYDRTKEERRGQHILVRVSSTASPEDTLVAYKKIQTARERIIAGEDFTKVAREVSEDPSAQKNGGDLGYFKAFKMVYPFESAAYATAVGEVSEPFRTRFGYHIVQPTDSRLSKGKVTVAHIMVSIKQSDTTINPEQRIQEVYTKLKAGADFETLAQNYSDDKNSAAKGGELKPIEEGQLSIPLFEEKAFALKNAGSYTEPFVTKFGWHIIKLLGKDPVPSFEEMKKSLEQRIVKDARAQVIDDNLNDKLRAQYAIGSTQEIANYFKQVISEDYRTAKIDLNASDMEKVAFKLGKDNVTYREYGEHLIGRAKATNYPSKNAYVDDQVAKFTTRRIRTYHEDHLEEIDPEFNAVLREYKEGLLLFDLLESQIWEKAKSDSIGLQQFYEENRSKFKSEPKVEAVVVTAPNAGLAKKAKKLLKGDSSFENIQGELKDVSDQLIVVSKSINLADLPEKVKPSEGTISVIKDKEQSIIYKVLNRMPSESRELQDVKGLVTSAYQKKIEDTFVQDLRKDAEIEVNEAILKALEEKYND